MTGETDGRKLRKKSPRPKKTDKSNPAASETFRRLWADPVWREKMLAKNREAIERRKLNPARHYRRGVPDGMRKEEAMRKWAEARELAKKIMQHLVKTGQVDDVPECDYDIAIVKNALGEDVEIQVPRTDEAKAKDALTQTFVMAYSPMANHQTKLACLRTVLEYTKQKPTQKQDVTVKSAEDYLDLIAKEVNAT